MPYVRRSGIIRISGIVLCLFFLLKAGCLGYLELVSKNSDWKRVLLYVANSLVIGVYLAWITWRVRPTSVSDPSVRLLLNDYGAALCLMFLVLALITSMTSVLSL
jgi:hypothetical protein